MKTGAFAGRRKLGLTFADQAISSGSNFLVGVLVARFSGLTRFGGYMFAFAIWLVVVGVHRALITEPMIIAGATPRQRHRLLAQGFAAEMVLGVVASVAVGLLGAAFLLFGSSGYGGPLVALAPWLPSLLAQDFWRAMSFQQARPDRALANDVLFTTVQVGAFLALMAATPYRSVAVPIACWGVGATAGAALGLVTYGIRPAIGPGVAHLRRHWATSKWLLADFGTQYAADQAYLFYLAAELGSAAYGGFRASANLLGPVMVILQAGGNFGLPEASRRLRSEGPDGLRRLAPRLTLGALACVGLYGGVVSLLGGRLLSAVYGPTFGEYGTLLRLAALQYVVASLVFGQGICLKAVGAIRKLWTARVAVTAVSFTAVVALTHRFGLTGAGWAGVVTTLTLTVAVERVHRRTLRVDAPRPITTTGPAVPV